MTLVSPSLLEALEDSRILLAGPRHGSSLETLAFLQPLKSLDNGEGFGISGQKIGSPPKNRTPTTTDPTPHSRPSDSRTEKTPKENLHKEFRRDPGWGVKEGA